MTATEVRASFLMQDNLLWVSLMMRNLSDSQTAAIHAVPGMERAHIQSTKDASGELQAYVTGDPERWQEVKGHMANALPPQADLFRKKLRASTWEDTKPLVAGKGNYQPTKGMTVEGQKTMIIMAIRSDSSPPGQGLGVPRGVNDRVEQAEPRQRRSSAVRRTLGPRCSRETFPRDPSLPTRESSSPGTRRRG